MRRRRTPSRPSGRSATGGGFAGDLIAVAVLLQRTCLERRLTVAVAESCTGGLVGAALTEVAGSSGYFLGGVISYSNAAKEALLGVPHAVLERHGAVSSPVAAAMAMGARARFGADLAVGITGVAGPDGGTPDKPVGLVYIGIATATGVDTVRAQYGGDRATVRRSAASRALKLLHAAALEAGT